MARGPPHDLAQLYYDIPIVTRVLITLTVVISLACHLQFLSYDMVMFDWNSIYRGWKFHQLITPFFIQTVDFSLIFNLMFFYQQSKQLEQNVFWNKPADYIYFIILTSIFSLITAYAMEFSFLGDTLVFSVMYLWSRHYPNNTVSFYFGITFQGYYLPWISVLISAVFSASIPYTALIGIASAFIYFTLCEHYVTNAPKVITAPEFLQKLFPEPSGNGGRPTRTSNGYTAQAPASRATTDSSQDRWGKGYRLG